MDTYIKWMELSGFKSFNKAIRIKFNKGVSCIIGPNGSGKSNIIDAICFVLGKSKKKELRTESFSHLIFTGKQGKAKAAKVKICFDNSKRIFPIDEDEIVIERVVKENGKTFYRLNGKLTTKQEVLSLLSYANVRSDGYNIILQNEVIKFVNIHSEEIREIIKEIANIKVFEEKVHKANLELNKVENKIREVNIKIREKENFLKELEKEKERAKKWEELRKKLKILKHSLLVKEIEIAEGEKEKINKELKKIEEKILKLKEEKGKIESNINEIEKGIEEIEKELKEKGEDRYREVKKMLSEESNKLNKTLLQIERITNSIKEGKERIKRIEENMKENEEIINKINEEKNSLLKKREALNKEISSVSSKVKFAYSKIKYNDIEEIDRKIKKLIKEKEAIEKYKKLHPKLKEEEEKEKKLKSEIEEMKREIENIELEVNNKNKKIFVLESKISKERVIGKLKEIANVYGYLKDLFKITSNKEAILSLLYSKLKYVVVEDVEDAIKCINYLKERKLGRKTFIILRKIPKRESELSKFIVCNEKFKPIFDFFLHGYKISDKLEDKSVTKEGIIVNNFIVTGGYIKEELTLENLELLNELKKEVEELRKKKEELYNKLLSKKEALGFVTMTISKIKEELLTCKDGNVEEVESKIKELKKKKEELLNILEKIEEEQELVKEIDNLRREKQEIEVKISSLEAKLRIIERDNKELKNTQKALKKEIVKNEEKLKQLLKEKERIGKKIKELKKEESKLSKEVEKLIKRKDELNKKVIKESSKKYDIEIEIAKIQERANNMKIKLAEINAKINSLKEQEKEFESIPILQGSYGELKSKYEATYKQIESFGPVNMKALEIYNKIENEVNFLKERVSKLEEEKEKVLNLIAEYEKKKVSEFLNKFNELRINLEEVYSILSPGGEIDLKLLNEDDPLESEIELIARPKGKRVNSINSLSGGEKTMIAIAIIFALQKFKPAPFYVFDEIDAALDKDNSDRLAKFIKVNSKDKQFIIITHNDAIMAVADYLYGVSMKENGESKIVGLKL